MLFLIITILNSITTTHHINNQIASFLFLMYSHKIYEKSMKKSTNSENEKKNTHQFCLYILLKNYYVHKNKMHLQILRCAQ